MNNYNKIIIDNFRIALFSGVHKLVTALCNIFQHFLNEKKMEGYIFKKVIHI